MRIPLTTEEQEHLEELFCEYKDIRELLNEKQKDIEAIRDEIILMYQSHDIKRKTYQNKIFEIIQSTYYKYPSTCKNHKQTIKRSIEVLRMVNH